jgi:hypothetical protein
MVAVVFDLEALQGVELNLETPPPRVGAAGLA